MHIYIKAAQMVCGVRRGRRVTGGREPRAAERATLLPGGKHSRGATYDTTANELTHIERVI